MRSESGGQHEWMTGLPANPTPVTAFPTSPELLRAIGWPNGGDEWHRNIVLVSPLHFLSVSHYPFVSSDAIRFRGADGVVRAYPIAATESVMRHGQPTDLVVGTLATPVDPSTGVLPFPVANLAARADYLNRDVLVIGKAGKGATSRYSGFETLAGQALPFSNTENIYFDYVVAAGAATDLHFEGGDSGSPTLMMEGGRLCLTGVHSSIWKWWKPQGWVVFSDDVFLPDYLTDMDALMEPLGYHVKRRYAEAVTLQVSVEAVTPMASGSPGEVGVTLTVAGAGMAHNLSVEIHATGASWVGGPGWLCEHGPGDTWSCRRAGLAAGTAAALSAYWLALPAEAVSVGATAVADGGAQATAAVQVSTATPDPYQTWAKWLPEPGLDADPDHDGLSNLLEYAFGGNPAAAGGDPQPVGAMIGGMLQLDFPRRSDAAARGLSYAVEYSTDLVNWSAMVPAGASISVHSFGSSWPGFEQVQIRVPRQQRGYARVKVNLAG
ncbi:hypothetical protein [Haloferula sargassicola]|uniref:Peptidase S1 domain-containing protein n=1 Tax=Haloferula sargassicola TaxID=490096 RepID=A0ABP9URM3_9BACT